MKRWKTIVTLALFVISSAVSLIASANQQSPIIGWCVGTLTAWTLANIPVFRSGE